jgi:hypothetical protein
VRCSISQWPAVKQEPSAFGAPPPAVDLVDSEQPSQGTYAQVAFLCWRLWALILELSRLSKAVLFVIQGRRCTGTCVLCCTTRFDSTSQQQSTYDPCAANRRGSIHFMSASHTDVLQCVRKLTRAARAPDADSSIPVQRHSRLRVTLQWRSVLLCALITYTRRLCRLALDVGAFG